MIISTDTRQNSWPPKSIHNTQQIDKMRTKNKTPCYKESTGFCIEQISSFEQHSLLYNYLCFRQPNIQ